MGIHVIDKDLHVQDFHDIILEFFTTTNDTFFTKGTMKDFRVKLFFTIVFLAVVKLLAMSFFPGILSSILSIALIALMAELVLLQALHLNKLANSKGPAGILQLIGISTLSILLIGGLLGF